MPGPRPFVLLAACHPEPAALVTVAAGLLSLGAGRGWGTLWVVAAVAAGQMGIGWSNDYLDRDLDRTAGRLDKPVAAGAVRAGTVRRAAEGALAAAVPLSLAAGAGFALAHLAAVAAALAYNAGLKARPVSVAPYAVAFGLLPAAVTLGLPGHPLPPVWAVGAGALMGAGAHFTQVLPDVAADRGLGLRGLPQIVGERTSAILAVALLFAACLAAALGPGRPGAIQLTGTAAAAALTVAILAAAAAGHARLAFRLTMGVAALAVLTFLASGRSL